ncbi:MAG: Crp/Fnr family transcriptional regulator, partial [Bacteroidales bacterium]|nr:Crp/Fnr family transcriptional regulator [Bacteroidales bacterium]
MSKIEMPHCEFCVQNFKSIFKSLSDDELESVNFEKSCRLYKKGDVIFHEGNRTSGFYCVSSGIIKVFKTGIEGKEQIIRFVKKGDILGYRSLISKEAACSTAKVIEETILCFIPSETLFQLVKSNIDFTMELMQRTAKELGESNKFLIDMAQKNVRERLASVLIMLAETFSLDDNKILQITLTREELANIVGT